ncbi:hybrid sensor histidine kinase/response regulator [Tannerella forsythia]|uniref:hybrid sensor histidine kinase/response regulator transcription factor n=1 Tax=Tannerella forsythia TaxID=28112 RepID=UPI00094F5755|nr:response regulator [Tannerella forsythia]OLQ19780.1 hybrid sensor histidine kinase/response regulator [Tannerella forsythia]
MQYDKYNLKATLQPHHEPFNSYGGGGYRLILSALAAFISVCLLLVSCGKKSVSFTPDKRKMADSIVRSAHDIDSLALLQKRMESEGDRLGSIIALREWGKVLRNESRFEEALNVHSKGQQQAEAVGDTLEWVQALNNIGTDYRRMGVLDVAQEYHYRAWTLSEECADTSFTARKNRAISLNGLGNIYMTLGNYERADSALRMALEGERQLHSALGQAINYANLGSIFEHRGQTDSAWVYYRKSMALNTEAGSTLGISLCHTYFGSLYEKARQYGKATEEYETAYRLMQESKDEWHALNSLIALADIYHTTGNDAKEMEYLGKAKAIAERIKSPEHLAEIHTLYYKHYKQTGDYRTALSSYEQAMTMQDSVLNMEKVNRIQNTSLNIERNRQAREMGEARHRLEQERTARYVGFGVLGIVLLVLSGVLTIVLYTNRLHRRNHLALKRLSALRENFFTNITHEFRTPLTVILGLSHNLQDADTEAVRENARTIERQGKGLLTLINQLLDISKIKSSVGNPDWCNGNITAHLTMIIEAYRDYARSRNIDLHFLAREAVEMDFVPDYVSKVMNNLLSNAFKFTPEYGKVSVLVWREGNCLFLDVSDTGEGIDKETVSHVFEPFYQAETEARSIGTGVGLALVKQIIDAVEGSITVESTVGKGTTFHIHVPIHHDSKRKMDSTMIDSAPLLPENETTLADSENDDNQCRLLVIEDNHDIAAYIGSLFADRYAVSYAANGKEGMEKALDLVPDLIITDLMMPGMDGLEVCRQVRGNEIINHIPIIVVTAKITEEERIKGLEAGADAYISKPFNADELRTRVEKLLDRHHRLRDKFSNIADTDKEQKLTDAERRFLAKAVDFIYHLLDKRHLDVNTLAEKLYMSPRQLHRKLVAITGDSPATYMLKIKMQKARNLLETKPGLTIEDIAEHCGFEHTPNFYSAFKKTYGVTPMDYRRGIGF